MTPTIVRVRDSYDGPEVLGLSLARWFENHSGELTQLTSFMEGRRKVYRNKIGLIVPAAMFRVVKKEQLAREIFLDVESEIVRARAKHPSNRFMMTALCEEAGESAQAMIDHSFGKDTPEHIYKELVQTMTVALRLILEGSQEFDFKGIFPNVQPSIKTPKTDCLPD